MAQTLYIPADDGDRPVLEQIFPEVAGSAPSAVAIVVVDKVADSTVTTSTGTASQSAVDDTLWLYDTADITGVNLDTVGFSQLAIRWTATYAFGTSVRWETLIVSNNRQHSNLVDDVWDEVIDGAHVTNDTSGNLLHILGQNIQDRSNNANLNAMLGVADSSGSLTRSPASF